MWVRGSGGTLVGYAGISRLGRTPPFEYEVHTIGVDPAYQGRGIGRRLLRELLDFARGGVVYLEVRTDNDAALALYRSVGFQRVACAGDITGSAAPTRTRCVGIRGTRHDDSLGHRNLLR